ncbi:hydrolase, TatD family protein [Nadsonia fulvescens var. elongata DSM 6958]|uniref:Hydrolase, TatD family protein n=1 Tax=Nadsonia fulvescens var. elongata DSM 6958 TaxID=857566 RepID=A0A1E3PNS4_9ASCO|nr:hydrolase, TatD family protein [Nadsonia fulvescens var. elongata DSM 6958]
MTAGTFMNTEQQSLRFYDIGANLTDPQFNGLYNSRPEPKHEGDLIGVVSRAQSNGVNRFLITGSNLEESVSAIKISEKFNGTNGLQAQMYTTAGIHPCHTMDIHQSPMGVENYIAQLLNLVKSHPDQVRALGELGLDYDRLHYAPADIQKTYFELQLDTFIKHEMTLPLFLHSRAAHEDFIGILKPRLASLPRGGVVHSFTGTEAEMTDYINLGLYIGINGCSLKTEENLAVVKLIPLNRLLLETDAPWCEIRPSHASAKLLPEGLSLSSGNDGKGLLPFEAKKKERFESGKMVRGRCEPCAITLVAHIVAELHRVTIEELAAITWKNSIDLLGE